MDIWPATLPQFVNQTGYGEQRVDGKLTTKMDSGPTVNRSLFSATPVNYKVTLTLTSAQVSILDTFYYSTCKNGVLAFTWIHPRTYAEADVRFVSVPSISNMGYDTFKVTFSMEILP